MVVTVLVPPDACGSHSSYPIAFDGPHAGAAAPTSVSVLCGSSSWSVWWYPFWLQVWLRHMVAAEVGPLGKELVLLWWWAKQLKGDRGYVNPHSASFHPSSCPLGHKNPRLHSWLWQLVTAHWWPRMPDTAALWARSSLGEYAWHSCFIVYKTHICNMHNARLPSHFILNMVRTWSELITFKLRTKYKIAI